MALCLFCGRQRRYVGQGGNDLFIFLPGAEKQTRDLLGFIYFLITFLLNLSGSTLTLHTTNELLIGKNDPL
jgi:hypothetical protein